MHKRRFLKNSAAAAVALSLPLAGGWARSNTRAPLNLLFLTADDMNWSLPGFMGGTENLTPNLDRLAARSHRFLNNRAAAPICQPSREAMMTGLMPHRSGGGGFTPIREGLPTLTSILKANGYFTAAIHKLEHMQPKSCFAWDFEVPGKDRNPLVYEQGAREAIAKAAAANRPFFINCNMNDPHRPFYGSPEAAEMDHNQEGPYKIPREITPEQVTVPPFLEDLPLIRQELAQYWNSTQRLDISIGKVLQVLQDSGQYDRTIIIFSSDHGMPFPFAKATCYDNGSRTPFVISWPGMGRPAVFEDLTCNVDILPTLLDILAIAAPANVDGRSLLPAMKGRRPTAQRKFVITEVNTVASGVAYPVRAIQNMEYSLVFSPWADGVLKLKVDAMRGLTYDAMVDAAKTNPQIARRVNQLSYGVPLAFYDLARDPGQRVNLIDDPACRERIAEMRGRLLENMERSGDPQLQNFQTLLAGGKPVVPQDPERYRLRNAE